MAGALRTVGQLAVGVIGYAIGGPLGFAVANTIFGLAFPAQSNQVRRFGDTNLQGSQIGTFIPQLYGQMGKVHGNIIDCSRDGEGKPAGILIRIKKEKVSAKGGLGSQTVKTEVGYLTAAYMLGEGPLYVDRIVKIDGSDEKAIYDRYGANNKKRGGTFTPEFAPDGTLISEVSNKIRMYFGTEYQEADTVLQGVHSAMPAYRGVCYVVFNQYEIPSQPTFQFYVRSPLTGREEIIIKRFEECGMPSTRYDLHNIWGHVNGAWVTSRTGARDLNESIAKLCYTDFIAANGIICDASRAYPYIWALPKKDMGAHLASEESVDAATIEMRGEEEFIAEMVIPFNDYDLNYDDNKAHALRTTKEQITSQDISIPISSRLHELVPFVKSLQDEDYTYDRTLNTPVMPQYIKISPGEVVTVPNLDFPVSSLATSTTDYFVTGQEVSPEGIVTLNGHPYNNSNYRVISGTDYSLEPRPIPSVPQVEIPMGIVMDGVPLTDEMADSSSIIVGACAPLLDTGEQSYWEGALCDFETDKFNDLLFSAESNIGKLTTGYSYLPEETTRINYGKTINITMHNGSLHTTTEEKLINNRANMLALCSGIPTEVMYVQFATVIKTGVNTYQISGILPGRGGSDYYTSINPGGYAMLLTDEDGVRRDAYNLAQTDNANIGGFYFWRFSANEEDTLSERFGDRYSGASRLPLSPTYIRKTGRNVGLSVSIAWCARSRYQFGATWTMTRASDPNNFLLEFKAGAALGSATLGSRVIANSTSAVITEAELISYYGSLPATLNIAISQISELVGPGHRRLFTTTL